MFAQVPALTDGIHSVPSDRGGWMSTPSSPARSISASPSPLKYTACRVASESGYPHRNRQHVRSRARTHLRNPQRFEWPRRLDIHTESADTFDQRLTLTVKIHSVPSGFSERISTPESATRSIARSHSPSESTAFRVTPEAGYPHRVRRYVRSAPHSHR